MGCRRRARPARGPCRVVEEPPYQTQARGRGRVPPAARLTGDDGRSGDPGVELHRRLLESDEGNETVQETVRLSARVELIDYASVEQKRICCPSGVPRAT